MSDLPYLERVWDRRKIRALLQGVAVPDTSAFSGYADVPLQSSYQKRCAAYDSGEPELVLESIQFERQIEMLPDIQVRAAISLALLGWHETEVGAAIRSNRTGYDLIAAGVAQLASMNRNRAEMRAGRS